MSSVSFLDDSEILRSHIWDSLYHCPLKRAYLKALRACRKNDAHRLECIIRKYGLKQSCCDGDSHGLMLYAALKNAASCITALHWWEWVPEEEKILVGFTCEHTADGGSHVITGTSENYPFEDYYDMSPLRVAARNFCSEAVEALTQCVEFDVADEDLFADMFALLEERPRAAEAIIVSCFSSIIHPGLKREVIEKAICRDKIDLVKQLMLLPGVGVEFDDEEARSLACSEDMLDFLLDSYRRRGDLMVSLCHFIRRHAHQQALRMIHNNQEALLRYDCEDGTRALVAAADVGCTQVIRELIDIGVPIDEEGDDGSTAIHQACASRDRTTDALGMLISRGADVNLDIIFGGGICRMNPDSNIYSNEDDITASLHECDTPLHAVCIANAPFEEASRRVRMLVEAGADPNAQNSEGETPLHLDAWRTVYNDEDYHKTSLRPLLISLGADKSIASSHKKSYTSQQILDGEIDIEEH